MLSYPRILIFEGFLILPEPSAHVESIGQQRSAKSRGFFTGSQVSSYRKR